MQYGTVTGRFLSPDGAPLSGTVRFVPDTTAVLVSGADPATVLPAYVEATLNNSGHLTHDGSLGVDLVIPEDTVTNPPSWTYRVIPMLKRGDQYVTYSQYSVEVTAAGADLASAAPVPAAAGAGVTRGKSAYEVWLEQGNTGSEADFLASIGGADLTGYATETYVDQAVSNVTPSESAVMDAVVKAQGAQYVYSSTEPTATTYTAADGSTYPVVWVSTTTVDGGTTTSVTATAPTFDDGTDTYTITATTGVDYYVGGVLTAAGTYSVTAPATVTITAQAQSGYTLTGTTSWSFGFTVNATYQDLVLAASPTHYLPLDGAVNDLGTAPRTWGATAITWGAGIGDGPQAAVFNGTSSVIEDTTTSADGIRGIGGSTAFTIEAIVRNDRPSGTGQNIYSQNATSEILLTSVAGISANFTDAGAVKYARNGGTIPQAETAHIAFRWDGATLSLVKNGAVVDTGPLTTASVRAVATAPPILGTNASKSSAWFQGAVAGFAVYRRALTDAELLDHAQAAGLA